MKRPIFNALASIMYMLLSGQVMAQAVSQPVSLAQAVARTNPHAAQEMLLATALAGTRVVAVGDHGTVVLSDDGGKSFRQARQVPTRVTLNGVSFSDAKNGWAAGHWGTIIRTVDGGESWTLQRTDTQSDRPLFAIHASDAQHAVAIGLWSLVMTTQDGGQHWQEVVLPTPPDGGKADRNLLGIFSDASSLYVAAERGAVLQSQDHGSTWSYLLTGYKGTFWTGTALRDGSLLVAGLRGSIYRSADKGKTWQAIQSGTQNSITGMSEVGDSVVAVALDGVVLQSTDQGLSFKVTQREDRTSLTAVMASTDGHHAIATSKHGVVADLIPIAQH